MSKTFHDLGLSEKALAAVDLLGYTDPTPVQEQAIPAVLAGRDVIAAAKTGTGKTAAFSLPTMDRLGHARHGQGPLLLIVTPTRELALQIESVCRTIAKRSGHRVTCVVGGVSYNPQIDSLRRGTDVLIATPGRLIDLMNQDAAHLNQVETLVLDEADRMLDMGFLPDMRRIVAACPTQRQTLLFSATIDSAIEDNMAHLLNNPVFVEIAHRGETADTIEQYRIPVDHRHKNDLLIALLNERGGTRIIVFARTRHRVDTCVRKLRKAGFAVEPIHSDRSQNQRKRAIEALEAGKCDILVATDVLARGIDIPNVNYVVNLDMPDQVEDYVHRIGRTGRAGEAGCAISFVTPENKAILRDIQKLIGKDIPEMSVESFDSSASNNSLAAKATRANAQNDPELATAVREDKSRKKAKSSRHSRRGHNTEDQRAGGQQRGHKNLRGNKSNRNNSERHFDESERSEQQGTRRGRTRRDQRNEYENPHKTRGTAKKQRKKNQRAGAAHESERNRKGRSANDVRGDFRKGRTTSNSHGDFRPGRSQRARRDAQHRRSQRG